MSATAILPASAEPAAWPTALPSLATGDSLGGIDCDVVHGQLIHLDDGE
ncbi:hypothetical protein ABCR94_33375 [Streptomyces sp. 21So2-11]